MKPNLHHLVNICSTCKSRVESYGQPAVNLLDLVCYYYLEGIPIFIDSDEETTWQQMGPVIAYLENKLYIVTTEITHSSLVIKPTDAIKPEDGQMCYCWCNKVENK